MNDWKNLVGKEVRIFLKINNLVYNGRVISAGDDYLKILDKFEKIVYIVIDNISTVEEIR